MHFLLCNFMYGWNCLPVGRLGVESGRCMVPVLEFGAGNGQSSFSIGRFKISSINHISYKTYELPH